MVRPLRLDHPGALWHVFSRGNERRDVFRSCEDRELFLQLLGDTTQRFRWLVYAYTLMDNHYHLVFETPEANLSRGMHSLNGRYAQLFNRRRDRCGHLFQGRFKSVLVEKETHLLELARYVVLNPVRAGMVTSPDQWPWSSYKATTGEEAGPDWLRADLLLRGFHRSDLNKARQIYRNFVLVATAMNYDPARFVVAGAYLGSQQFIEGLRPLLDQKSTSAEFPKDQVMPTRPSLGRILEVVSLEFGTTLERIHCQPREEARKSGGMDRPARSTFISQAGWPGTKTSSSVGIKFNSEGGSADGLERRIP